MNQIAAFSVLLVAILLIFSGAEYYTYYSMNTQLTQTTDSLDSQITTLQNNVESLQSTLAQTQQAQNSSSQQITTMQKNLQAVQTQLSQESSEISSLQSNSTSTQQQLAQISKQLQNLTTTVQELTAKVNSLIPQVPLSTLVIVGDSYNGATKTFTLQVQNMESYIVYAQFSAIMYGVPCCGFGNTAGSYTSQVFQFKPISNVSVSFNITQANYYGDCIGTVSTLELDFVAATQSSSGLQVSPSYTFQISPGYPNPYQVCP
jgi:uncharacterized protein (UPF0333 family)